MRSETTESTEGTKLFPFTWIETAIAQNAFDRALVIGWDGGEYRATLVFGDLKEKVHGTGETAGLALRTLDETLQEDAAQEMRDAGVV